MREIRVFVSSPSDAQFERRRLDRVVGRLNGELRGSVLLRAIRWETSFYSAHETFQTQIPPADECDIVVGILRHRLGTELPPDFPRMPDGSAYPSGTAYEVLSAIEARRTNELPDVYVFRYAEPPTVALDDPGTQTVVAEQWERLKGFFDRWFLSSEGQFKAAFHVFSSTDEFEENIERLLRQWIVEHVLADRSVTWPIEIKGSPFRGLDAFDAAHAGVFFGRSRDITRAVDALKEAHETGAPFLMILGASGAGKSSLARAGLVPRITAAGVVPSVDTWRVASFQPAERGGDPFLALAESLLARRRPGGGFDDEAQALPEISIDGPASPRQLADRLAAGEAPADLILAARDRVGEAERGIGGYDRPVAANLLVVVDQLDEIFAGDIAEETRTRFGELLAGLVRTGRVWVAATLRADLYERYITVPALLALKTEGATYDLAPPGPAELAEIVRQPAAAARLVYETDGAGMSLDERLLADAERADMLPLLQFTLNRLFEERIVVDDEIRLTHAAYDALGGLSGAIDQEAERALAGLDARIVARLPRLLRDLATPGKTGEGDASTFTVRPALLSHAAHDADAASLVQALVEARILLSSSGEAEPTIRIAHQSVLESWRRAREIVQANADFFRVRQEVEDERRRWEDGGRRRDRLIRPGVPLAEAESIAQRFRDELSPQTRAFVQASGNRARLRQRMTAAAAIVFLGVAVGAAYLGWRASVAEDLAQRNYLTARNTVDTIVFDVVQGLRHVEGMRIESVRTILQEVEKAVDELEQTTPNEAGLFRSRATMNMLYGDAYKDAGDRPAAVASYEKALAATRILQADQPDSIEARRDLVVDLTRLADARRDLGDAEGAFAAYDEALGIARANVTAEPETVLWKRDLAMVLERLGDMNMRAGKSDAAETSLQESLAVGRRAVELEPDNAKAQDDVAVALERIGDLNVRNGDHAAALSAFQEGLALRRKLSADDPGHMQRQRAVSASLVKLGDLKIVTGNMAGALADFSESLAILRHLAALDEENVRVLSDMSVLVGKVGEVKLLSGDFESALAARQESLDISRRLAALEPANPEWRRNVSVASNLVGDLRLRTGNPRAALQAYQEGLEAIRQAVELSPQTLEWRGDVNYTQRKIADAQVQLGNTGEALTAYEEVLAEARALVRLEPDNPTWSRQVALALERLGDVRMRAGDADGAAANFSESRDIFRALTRRDPQNLDWRRQFHVAITREGDLLLRKGDAAGALAAYEDALAQSRAIAEMATANTKWQRDLAFSLNRVSDARRGLSDPDGALAGYEEALAIGRRLVEIEPTNVEYQRDVAFALNRIGDVAVARGDSAAAVPRYEEALEIGRRLLAVNPDSSLYRDGVALGLQRLGDLKAGALDVDAAASLYGQELGIRRDLLAKSPDDTAARRHVALSLLRVGNVRAYKGEKPGAIALFDEALGIMRSLTGSDPANQVWQSDRMVLHLRIADTSEKSDPRRIEMLSEALPIAIRLQNAGALSGEWADLPAKIRALLAE